MFFDAFQLREFPGHKQVFVALPIKKSYSEGKTHKNQIVGIDVFIVSYIVNQIYYEVRFRKNNGIPQNQSQKSGVFKKNI